MEHVQFLASTIGPRGSTMPGEARAADYVSAELEGFGLTPERQPFRSARSAWWAVALFRAVVLDFCLLFVCGGRRARVRVRRLRLPRGRGFASLCWGR